jgi:hypothetical protein
LRFAGPSDQQAGSAGRKGIPAKDRLQKSNMSEKYVIFSDFSTMPRNEEVGGF